MQKAPASRGPGGRRELLLYLRANGVPTAVAVEEVIVRGKVGRGHGANHRIGARKSKALVVADAFGRTCLDSHRTRTSGEWQPQTNRNSPPARSCSWRRRSSRWYSS